MARWSSGFRLLAFVSAIGSAWVSVGCGGGTKSTSGSPAGAGQTGAGDGGMAPGAGSGGQGATTNSTGGTASIPRGSTAAEACRDYFTTVCARIRECRAPMFRPCESPIDACPGILFADGSGWSIEQVVACTAAWKTQTCDALAMDQGPACSQIAGARPSGDPCVFDVQCKTGRCSGGIVPGYQATCGKCVVVAPSHGACSDQQVCPATQECTAGTCVDRPASAPDPCADVQCPEGGTCTMGLCVAPPGVGAACTPVTTCAAGLACQIEIVQGDANEPKQGTCQALPAIGTPCLPTFSHIGVCVDGGTCSSRPTGDCVPLVAVGQSCGYTACVDGAYCQIYGYDNVPQDICYLRGQVGAVCDFSSSDHGTASCAEGLDCICSQPPCELGSCQQTRTAGQSCNGTTEVCGTGLACQSAVCVATGAAAQSLPAGTPCARSTAFGREDSPCALSLECLCTSSNCAKPVCAQPRNLGESCDDQAQICRQGLTCSAGLCADDTARNLEALSCPAKAP